MSKIRYVQNNEELEWFRGPSWLGINITADYGYEKFYITEWLEKHTKNIILIYNGAVRPAKGDMGWATKLLGEERKFTLFFEDRDEALHFKMSYMKYES